MILHRTQLYDERTNLLEKMQAFPRIRSSDLSFLPGPAFSISRTQLTFPNKLFSCRANFADSGNGELPNLGGGPANLLVAEKEAKAVLTLFFKKQGFSKAVVARTISKSALFIDHLISRLHSVHKNRYLVGRELTTLEIRDALYPYLETLYEEFGDILVDVVENFPNPPPIEERSIENLSIAPVEGQVVSVPAPTTGLNSKQLKALARLTDDGSGKPPPHIIYLTELGMEIEVIKKATLMYPPFAYCSLDGNIKPLVEFLLDLGVPKSDIPAFLAKRPLLCTVSLPEHIIPTLTFLENVGMEKKQLPKVIYRFPSLLTYSREKLQSNLDYLYELGIPREKLGKVLTRYPNILGRRVETLRAIAHCLCELGLPREKLGKVLTRFPNIVGFSVESLRATAQYFNSIGADVGAILRFSPHLLCRSIDAKLKPMTEFFLERGFSLEEVASMVSRFGNFYALSLSNNIMPKWEFFLTMGYPKSDLVKYPVYFGFSLELRIKLRYALLMESGATMSLGKLLCPSDNEFDEILKRKMEKHVG